MGPEQWLWIAGVGTWFAAVIPAAAGLLQGRLLGGHLAWWATGATAFLAAFVAPLPPLSVGRCPRGRIVLLLIQALAALTMVGAGRDTLAASVLLVVVAAQLPGVLPSWTGLPWIAAQTAALIAIFSAFMLPVSAATYGLAFGGFQLFALGTGALAQRERRAREALSAAHAELLAARSELAERSRAAERLRISRDLHDMLGHHLTALSLQLDVASHLTEGKAAQHLQQAHAITRLLLADVRDVVGQLRDGVPGGLAGAVRALAVEYAGRLAIHVDVPEALPPGADAHAQAILRCVQEIVTNATRHARARNLWVTIGVGAEGLTVLGRDDGPGVADVVWGHGLTGMRERFEACAGHLDVATSPGRGFTVKGVLPHVRDSS